MVSGVSQVSFLLRSGFQGLPVIILSVFLGAVLLSTKNMVGLTDLPMVGELPDIRSSPRASSYGELLRVRLRHLT